MVDAESTLNATTSPIFTEVVHEVNVKSDAICCDDKVGFSVPVIVLATVGMFPLEVFQTSITQLPGWSAITVHPVIVPPYGTIKNPFSPVVKVDPPPSMVIPNEPDIDPGLNSPENSAYEDEMENPAYEDEMEFDADMALEAVPCKSPMKLPVNDPVLYVWVKVSKLELTA